MSSSRRGELYASAEINLNELQVEVYESGATSIWIPVSSRSPKGVARAMLPFKGMKGTYTHGFKADPVRSSYFEALISIQQAYLTNEVRTFSAQNGPQQQRRDKWRHGNEVGSPLLGPTSGWVKIQTDALNDVTEEVLAAEIERTGKRMVSFGRLDHGPEGEMFRSVSVDARTFQLKFRAGALQVWTSSRSAARVRPTAVW